MQHEKYVRQLQKGLLETTSENITYSDFRGQDPHQGREEENISTEPPMMARRTIAPRAPADPEEHLPAHPEPVPEPEDELQQQEFVTQPQEQPKEQPQEQSSEQS